VDFFFAPTHILTLNWRASTDKLGRKGNKNTKIPRT